MIDSKIGKRKRKGRTTHGYSKTPEYKAWKNMKGRCLNTNDKRYECWGGRGITICQNWVTSFEAFLKDMGKKPSSYHSLDRIDNNKGYCPENCRWATTLEQIINRRCSIKVTYNGMTKTLSEWCRELKVPYRRAYKRMKFFNWPIDQLFN